MYRDAGLTAKNLGHPSPTLLRKDYNNAVTRAEAERFWSIAPGGVGGGKGFTPCDDYRSFFSTF
jgi:hypothetical protein